MLTNNAINYSLTTSVIISTSSSTSPCAPKLFTYAYVFNKEGFIIEWMKKRMSQRSLNEEPVKRNPDQGFGFEKSAKGENGETLTTFDRIKIIKDAGLLK